MAVSSVTADTLVVVLNKRKWGRIGRIGVDSVVPGVARLRVIKMLNQLV